MKRALLLGLSLVLSSSLARADDAQDLQRLFSLLGGLRMGDDYAAVKKQLPEIGELKPYIGDGNTEATVETKIADIPLTGGFSFVHGKLVSHGFRSDKLTPAQAHRLLLLCIPVLEKLYGPGERKIGLSTDPEGDCPGGPLLTLQFNWQKDGKIFGLDVQERSESTGLYWGAQSASPSGQ